MTSHAEALRYSNLPIREVYLEDGNIKDDVEMANKLRGIFIYGRITPFIRYFHVVFDVPVLKLNLPNVHSSPIPAV